MIHPLLYVYSVFRKSAFQMAVDDCNLDNGDLQDLILDNIEKGYCGSDNWRSSSFSESPKSQLCVPPDPIEDLDWFPTFADDFISLNDVEELTTEQPNYCFVYDKPNQPSENLPYMDFPVTFTPNQPHDKNYEISGEPRYKHPLSFKNLLLNERVYFFSINLSFESLLGVMIFGFGYKIVVQYCILYVYTFQHLFFLSHHVFHYSKIPFKHTVSILSVHFICQKNHLCTS